MRILLVSPFLPYPGVPHAGGKLVCFLLENLSRRHSVFLVSRIFPGEEAHLPGLVERTSGIETVPAGGPVVAGNPVSTLRVAASYRRLCRAAENVLDRETFDICQVEFTETGVFWKRPKAVPSVITCHDVIAKPAYRRYRGSRGIARVVRWGAWKGAMLAERRSLSKFDRVFALSETDRDWGMRCYPDVLFRVLRYPAGLYFEGLPRMEADNRILFVGALNRPQNIASVRYFHQRVWPAVRRQVPGVEFWVTGIGLPRELHDSLSGDPQVKLTGFVERVESVYKTAAVFVAPILEGGGVIVKILDAMAAGVAVVTTQYGNEGIGAKAEQEVLVADDPAEFAAHVVRLLKDREFRKRVASSGKRFVEKYFSAGTGVDTIEQTYREIVSRPGAG